MRLRVGVLASLVVLALIGAPATLASVGGSVVPQLTPVPAAHGLSTGQLALFNDNTAPNVADADVVSRIALLPSCGDTKTPCATPDPGVLAVDPSGGSGSGACAGTAFRFGAPDPDTGQLAITPAASLRLDPGKSCVITFKFRLLKLPPHPLRGQPAGTTRQIAAAQFDDPRSRLSTGVTGSGTTSFAPAVVGPVLPPPTCKLSVSASKLLLTASTKGKLSSVRLAGSGNARVRLPRLTARPSSSATATLTRVSARKSSEAVLTVTDSFGQATRCTAAIVSTDRKGKPQQLRLPGLPRAEHSLTVINGSPPLRQLTITVNGRKLSTIRGLKARQSRTVNLASKATRTSNTVVLGGSARQAASAYVLITDAG